MAELYDGPPPRKLRNGRKSAYEFWRIPEGKGMVFEGAVMKNVVSAAWQFKQTYGGEYSARTLENGNVLVHCLSAPKKKHPAQVEEEWLVENERRKEEGQL